MVAGGRRLLRFFESFQFWIACEFIRCGTVLIVKSSGRTSSRSAAWTGIVETSNDVSLAA